MEEITQHMEELKISLDNLKADNESLRKEMQVIKEVKDENSHLKGEVRALRCEILELLKSIHPDKHQQLTTQHQRDQFAVITPAFPYKWGDLSMLTDEEKKDLQFEMRSRNMTSYRYEEDDDDPSRFDEFIRKGEDKYDDEDDDDGITNTYFGSFTTPIKGQYRFDVKGKMETDEECIANWYICCVRVEDDIFDPANPENFRRGSDVDDQQREMDKKRKEVFLQQRKRQKLFTITEENQKREMSVGIDCDKGIRVWLEVEIEKGRFFTRYCNCLFSGRLTK